MKRLITMMMLLIVLICPLLVTAQPEPDQTEWHVTPLTGEAVTAGESKYAHYPVTADGRARLIVTLDTINTTNTRRAHSAIQAQQAAFLAQLETAAPSAQVTHQYSRLFNGMSMLAATDDIRAIATLPHVTAIHPDEMLVPMIDENLDLIDVDHMWNKVGGVGDAGEDMKIAIIDSGIDPDNPLFVDSGYSMPDGYPKGYCTNNSDFCNDKVIAARWYGKDGENGSIPAGSHTDEVASPLDIDGNGSHVAGIAAGNHNIEANVGNGVTTEISGVAPRAWLMAYKVCWRDANCLTSNAIEAIEDAVDDGADVINLSLGRSTDTPLPEDDETPLTTAINSAIAEGVPVVVAAGNDGNAAGTITCPGCAPNAITVGSVTTGRVHAYPVNVTGPGEVDVAVRDIPSFLGDGMTLDETISGNLVDAADIDSDNADGCLSFSAGSLNGSIVLTERGNCTFATKLSNASTAGANAVIIFDTEDGQLFTWRPQSATLPAVFIDKASGLALRDRIDDVANSTVEIVNQLQSLTNPEWSNWVIASSSRGPSGIATTLKPDLVAPGSYIVSGGRHTSDGATFEMQTGSASAAPHVTGAIAMLLQLHPDWTPAQIKSALIAQSNINDLKSDDGTKMATPHDRGGGRIDLDRLSEGMLFFSNPSWSNPQCTMTCTWTTVMENSTDTKIKFDGTITNTSGGTWSLSPDTVTLDPGANIELTITMDSSSLTEFEWHFADMIWTTAVSGLSEASIPMAVRVFPTQSLSFEKSVSPSSLPLEGGVATWEFVVRNTGTTTQTMQISDPIQDGMTYKSFSLVPPLEYDQNDVISAEFVADPLYNFREEAIIPYQDLAALNVPSLDCPGLCDDDTIVVNDLDFTFEGKRYTTLYINSNGFVSVVDPLSLTQDPQEMPSSTKPNGIIAPFWTDLDLRGNGVNVEGGEDTIGSGNIYLATLSTEQNPEGWTVIEWHKAEHWGTLTNEDADKTIVSFQIWIANGTDEISFVYGDMQNAGTFPTAVGVESVDGTSGRLQWFKNGDTEYGTLPSRDKNLTFDYNEYRMSFQTDILSGTNLTEVTNIATLNDGTTNHVATAMVRLQNIPTAVKTVQMGQETPWIMWAIIFPLIMLVSITVGRVVMPSSAQK